MVKKINIKKLFLIFMLIVLAFVFCGCATIQASVITNEDGTVDQIVTIKLNEETMQSTSILEIKTDIQKVANDEAKGIVSEYNTKWQIELLYADTDEKIAKLNSIKNGADVVTSKWSEDTFAIGVRFKNIDAYKFYHGRTNETPITFEKQEHFFYTKNYYYARNIYTSDLVLFNRMKEYFTRKYSDVIDVENVNIHYTYITESKREHSDADYVEMINGKYYHTWVVDQDNIEESIMFYYNIANTGNWILLCVGITLIVSIILLSVAIIKKKIKLKNNKNK